ncbi:SDR family NAD(P)-dependent oxidoreductase [Thalassotalea mangrovi]|uniref:SDR family NAD(P)-dependent oxidoreductase n=1 Tax=Thalassotalea mangrovi TaxID=2572245 RepID=A0A4U1B9S5_9GAMM|nr:SDR family NAD(P)-dependent oxidoreductase [Thalassotalea mangrovi]TKB47471.1 SDR family NAD(P)-dependent oxidoreductase [Thalassotalea mangrovi]
MKQVLITGATSGIGEALALHYANQDYAVIACGRNQARLEELSQRQTHIQTLAFDITLAEQVAEAAAQVDALDIVILNAGDCEYIDDAGSFDGALFKRVITVNLLAMGDLLEHFIKKLRTGGQLVIVSSSVTYLPLPRAEAYGASKAGVDYLAKTLAFDLAPEQIDVTLVQPGFIKTPLTDKNDFSMPFLLTAEQAAERIFKGVQKRRKILDFPKRFTYLLRLLSWLPFSWWCWLLTRKKS